MKKYATIIQKGITDLENERVYKIIAFQLQPMQF